MSDAVFIAAVVTVAPEHAEAAEAELKRCLAASRKEALCQHYVVYRDVEQKGRFTTDEKWATAEAFDAHLATPHFNSLAKALQSIGAKIDIMKLRPLDVG